MSNTIREKSNVNIKISNHITMDKAKKKKTTIARTVMFGLLVLLPLNGKCQRLLTLDSCRAMALRNNKQMSVAKVKQDVNAHLQKSARTKYLPHVNA